MGLSKHNLRIPVREINELEKQHKYMVTDLKPMRIKDKFYIYAFLDDEFAIILSDCISKLMLRNKRFRFRMEKAMCELKLFARSLDNDNLCFSLKR